jgi:hypothetical protein
MWWTAAITRFKKIPWQVWALSGLVGSFWLWGHIQYGRGQGEVQDRWNASVERGKVIVKNLEAGQGKVTTKIEVQYKDRVKVIHEKGNTITKLVTKYIPVGTPDLPGGFRLLHDSAVYNTVPGTTEGVDSAPVPVATATTTITRNYTTCNAAISDLEGTRQWIREQRQLYLDQCKQRGVHCSTDN